MRHVLVPLDGSDLAVSVVPVALTLALAAGVTVRLVTVKPQATPLGSARAAAAYLEDIAECLRTANVSVQTNVRVGESGLTIVNGRASAARMRLSWRRTAGPALAGG